MTTSARCETNTANPAHRARPFGLSPVSASGFRAHLTAMSYGTELKVFHQSASTLLVDEHCHVRAVVQAARLDAYGENTAPAYYFDLDGLPARAPAAVRYRMTWRKYLGTAHAASNKFWQKLQRSLQRKRPAHNSYDATPAVQWHRVRLTAA